MNKLRKGLLALALICACASPVAPQTAERFDPLPEYSVWWDEMRACAATPLPHFIVDSWPEFHDIDWWVVPGGSWYSPEHGVYIAGMSSGDDIYILEVYLFSSSVVKHEMLHYLGFSHPGDVGPYSWPFVGCAHPE